MEVVEVREVLLKHQEELQMVTGALVEAQITIQITSQHPFQTVHGDRLTMDAAVVAGAEQVTEKEETVHLRVIKNMTVAAEHQGTILVLPRINIGILTPMLTIQTVL